ncbi:type II toxin-antitoxin system antitoxin SocA domain-containing protein [Methanobrevibacter sp.]
MEFNREKYINLIMYILSRCYNKPQFGKTVLCSILYFIDFGYYERYGELLTNETYIKSKRGIKPLHFRKISNELISKNQLFMRKEPYYHYTLHRYYPLTLPLINFRPKEMEIINLSIDSLSNSNATSITKYARNDPPIHIADFGEKIDYRYVFSRNEKYTLMNK